MSERAAAKIFVDGRSILVEALVHGVDLVIRWFALDWCDCRVFEALYGIID